MSVLTTEDNEELLTEDSDELLTEDGEEPGGDVVDPLTPIIPGGGNDPLGGGPVR